MSNAIGQHTVHQFFSGQPEIIFDLCRKKHILTELLVEPETVLPNIEKYNLQKLSILIKTHHAPYLHQKHFMRNMRITTFVRFAVCTLLSHLLIDRCW